MLTDTSPEMTALHRDRIRAMTCAERAEAMRGLTLAVQRLAFAGMRERFPDDSDDEIWLRLAVNRLGADLVRKAYGRLPGEP